MCRQDRQSGYAPRKFVQNRTRNALFRLPKSSFGEHNGEHGNLGLWRHSVGRTKAIGSMGVWMARGASTSKTGTTTTVSLWMASTTLVFGHSAIATSEVSGFLQIPWQGDAVLPKVRVLRGHMGARPSHRGAPTSRRVCRSDRRGRAYGVSRTAQGNYFFNDGLNFELENWAYCKDDDRRFYSETQNGLKPAGQSSIGDRSAF